MAHPVKSRSTVLTLVMRVLSLRGRGGVRARGSGGLGVWGHEGMGARGRGVTPHLPLQRTSTAA